MSHSTRKTPGQALVVMAVFAVVLFILVGLGLDSGMLYLGRRHLQNVADAACLAASTEFGLGGDAAAARLAANQYIIDNIDESAKAAFNLPNPISSIDFNSGIVGTGQNLTRGIEVSDSGDVRVAVTFPAFTYFVRLAGIETYDVMARAHCGATKGGGVLPIAVVRFPGYDRAAPCDPTARVSIADTGRSLPQLNGTGPDHIIVRDILEREGLGNGCGGVLHDGSPGGGLPNNCSGGTRRNWFDWDNLGDPATKTGAFHDACNPAGMPSNLNDWRTGGEAVIDPNAGYPLAIAGLNATPNVGNPSFTGPVLLDLREISKTPLYYNGMTDQTSTNAWKDSIANYLRTQYPGPDVLLGQELAIVNGVNTGSVLDAIDDRFDGGEIVTALIYNGIRYASPNFQLAVSCKPTSASTPDNPNCNNPTPVANGKLIYRVAPPSPELDSACTYDGSYYIGDASYSSYNTTFLNPATNLRPAQYLVEMTPDPVGVNSNAAGLTIELTARLSGANTDTFSDSGSAATFGGMKVKWEWATGSTGWLDPGTPVNVPMTLADSNNDNKWDATRVTLKVIQTAMKTQSCTPTTGSSPGIPVTVTLPDRAAGAHTIQVIGRVATSQTRHSDYGQLEMRNYATDDYYLSFANDPSGEVVQGTPQQLAPQILQLQKAGTSTFLKWSQVEPTWKSGCRINWFSGTSFLGTWGCNGQGPTGLQADLKNGPGNAPALEIRHNSSVATGNYSLDVELGSSPLHSTRFLLRVESELNNSIDSWVTAVCYANFQITTNLSQASTPNNIWGRAVSGCLEPDEVTTGLTSRLIPW